MVQKQADADSFFVCFEDVELLFARHDLLAKELYDARIALDQEKFTCQNTFNHWITARDEVDAIKGELFRERAKSAKLVEALKSIAVGGWSGSVMMAKAQKAMAEYAKESSGHEKDGALEVSGYPV